MNRQRLVKCECGFGDGFYHYESDSTHEYNPGVTEDQATRLPQAERKPLAKFFGHIDGRRVKLLIYLSPGACLHAEQIEVSFFYKDYGGDRNRTYAAAVNRLLEYMQQPTLF